MLKSAERICKTDELFLSTHAIERMGHRHVSQTDIENVISYGRCIRTRGAVIYVVGAKEVKQQKLSGINLDHCEAIHVLCSHDGKIITVYRNHDLRGLKPKSRRSWNSKPFQKQQPYYLEAA